MIDSSICSLNDLNNFRSAPLLDKSQSEGLLIELIEHMNNSDWFTVGIMAPSVKNAINVINEIESYFNWPEMRIVEKPSEDGPVFLKANQKTGDIYLRIEHGLGEGILLSCQHENKVKEVDTFGPFPLDFFKKKE